MSQRHPLASPESWVELRDFRELLAGDQMDIQDAIDAETASKVMRQMTNALICALVVDWKLPMVLPIPSQSPEGLRRLTVADYMALKKLIEPAQEYIFPTDPEPETAEQLAAAAKDEGSPTGAVDA